MVVAGNPESVDAVVVGAGLSGLTAALRRFHTADLARNEVRRLPCRLPSGSRGTR